MKTHKIIDESAHDNYTQIPNILHSKELSSTAFRLYLWFKGVSRDKGSCWQCLNTISMGCQMSKPTITKGRRELEDQGLITTVRKIQENGSDKLIIKITDIWEENKDAFDIFQPQERKKRLHGQVKKNGLAKPKKLPLIRYTNKEEGAKAPSRKRKTPSSFDRKATKQFRCVVESHIKVNKKANMDQWAHQFRLLRERDGVTEDEIRKAINWYKVWIGLDYMPEAYSAETFREKYNNNQIPAAMKRTEEKSSNGKADVHDIFNELQVMGVSLGFDQADVDDASLSLSIPAGTFTVEDIPG